MEIKQEELCNGLLCHTCLCVGRNIYKVTNENLKKYYYDILDEVPLNKSKLFDNLLICWECKAALKKCWGFREQVQDSYRILQTYTSENLHEYLLSSASMQGRLVIHHNKPIAVLEGAGRKDLDSPIAHVKVENDQEYDKGDDTHPKSEPVTDVDSDAELDSKLQLIGSVENGDSKRRGRLNHEAERTMENETRKSIVQNDVAIFPIVDRQDKTNNECPLSDGRKTPNTSAHHSDAVDWAFTQETSNSEQENENSDDFQNESNSNQQEIKVEMKRKTSSSEEHRKSSRKSKKRKNINTKENLIKEKVKKKFKLEKETKKVITVELTYDEMVLERENDSKRESYVNAEFKCVTCLLGFMQSNAYRRHMKTKHSPTIGDYRCPICETVISSVDSFTAHYKRHMRRYECSLCHKRTTDLKVMHQHYYTMHEISLKQYTCTVCGKISNSIDTHRYHTDSHKARVQCPDCDKTFRHRAGLMNHRVAVHERTVNKYPCDLCDKVFRWKTSLSRHKDKHDAKVKGMSSFPYCSLCRIHFASVCSYQRHMKNSLKHVTQDQLRYICDHCNGRFCDKTKLRDHIEEKHLHMTFHCHICTKPYKNRVGLDQHIRNVHKGRPKNKMCHHCGRGFPTKVQLESHIRTHTGERPFICEYCPTTFSQQSNLSKHYRQVHLNIKSKRYPICKKPSDDTQQACKVAAHSGQVVNDNYRQVVMTYSPSRPADYLEY